MKLGQAIDRYLKEAGLRTLLSSSTGSRLSKAREDLWKEWAALVGDEIAQETRISRLSKGVLTVDVSSSALLSELKNYLCGSLVSRLSERLKRPIHRIKFRLADSGETEGFSRSTASRLSRGGERVCGR